MNKKSQEIIWEERLKNGALVTVTRANQDRVWFKVVERDGSYYGEGLSHDSRKSRIHAEAEDVIFWLVKAKGILGIRQVI